MFLIYNSICKSNLQSFAFDPFNCIERLISFLIAQFIRRLEILSKPLFIKNMIKHYRYFIINFDCSAAYNTFISRSIHIPVRKKNIITPEFCKFKKSVKKFDKLMFPWKIYIPVFSKQFQVIIRIIMISSLLVKLHIVFTVQTFRNPLDWCPGAH